MEQALRVTLGGIMHFWTFWREPLVGAVHPGLPFDEELCISLTAAVCISPELSNRNAGASPDPSLPALPSP